MDRLCDWGDRGVAQDNRILCPAQNPELSTCGWGSGSARREVVLIPGCPQSLVLGAACRRGFLPEEIEGQSLQDSQVLRPVTFPHSAAIFSQGGVKHPVHAVSCTPVTAYRAPELLRLHRQAGDVVVCLLFCLTIDRSRSPSTVPILLRSFQRSLGSSQSMSWGRVLWVFFTGRT